MNTPARLTDFKLPLEGEVTEVTIAGRLVAIACSEGKLYAFQGSCSHDECPFSDGEVTDDTVICGCHGSMFSMVTGEVLFPPATVPIATYPVSVDGHDLLIALDGTAEDGTAEDK
jgi:3-phenylpropionate/trans-cinnamate dioxygenase ferredoxin subunit